MGTKPGLMDCLAESKKMKELFNETRHHQNELGIEKDIKTLTLR